MIKERKSIIDNINMHNKKKFGLSIGNKKLSFLFPENNLMATVEAGATLMDFYEKVEGAGLFFHLYNTFTFAT